MSHEDWEERSEAWAAALPEGARYLLAEDVAYIGCDHQHDWPAGAGPGEACAGKPHGFLFDLHMGDTFAYACSDGEMVSLDQIDEVVGIYKRWGPIGLVCWAAKQRKEDPVIEYTEDPVYQATWTALFGDLRVAPNAFNKYDRRWSSARLELDPWKPR